MRKSMHKPQFVVHQQKKGLSDLEFAGDLFADKWREMQHMTALFNLVCSEEHHIEETWKNYDVFHLRFLFKI